MLLNFKKIGLVLTTLSISIFIASIFRMDQDIKTQVQLERNIGLKALPSPIVSVFSNKFVESYRYRQGLFLEYLDFGFYFFAGHPRERIGVKETEKLPVILLPLIVLGIIKISSNLRWFSSGLFLLPISIAVFLADRNSSLIWITVAEAIFLSFVGLKSLIKKYV